jgi:hypothetical protein
VEEEPIMRRVAILVLLLAVPVSAVALELVTNGAFESDLAPAWKEDALGAAASVGRDAGYDGDPDFEVLVQKGTGNGHSTLNQTVVIPSVDVDVAMNVKIGVSATSGGPWAAAGVALHYENSLGQILGTTMVVGTTVDCPWIDDARFHMIPAPDQDWNGYQFNLGDELANLPGVDMMAVHQIRISLFGQVGGDC